MGISIQRFGPVTVKGENIGDDRDRYATPKPDQ